jgi:HTH-type transcriptional regulator, transcriptional repressor of NAD biosynthesis genes
MAPIVPPSTADRTTSRRLTRIVVTGSESTGKTLLARQLAEHYDVPWIPEFARDYADTKGSELTAADVDPIGRGQVAREDAVLRSAQGLVILDTDLLSTMVYGQQYYQFVPDWIPGAVNERLADLYLLCDIDVPWVADAVRDAQHQRPSMHTAFITQLMQLGASHRLIRGTGPERLSRALAYVAQWHDRFSA